MSIQKSFGLAVVAVLLLGACAPGLSPEEQVQTSIAQTLQIAQLETAAAAGQQSPTPEAPSETPTVAVTPTSSVPYVSVSQATNCRTGPGVNYDLITTVQVVQQAEVVAVFSSSYVVVANPNGLGQCWLWLQYASPTDFSAYNLPLATQPPTPTPGYVWEGNWTHWPEGGGTCSLTLAEAGNAITGTYNCPDEGYGGSVSGTLSADRLRVTGTWDVEGTTGPFEWQLKVNNTNQFIGNYNDGGFYWCGAKAGASQPSPCFANP